MLTTHHGGSDTCMHNFCQMGAVPDCSEDEMAAVVALALEEAGVEPSQGLDFSAFEAALGSADLLNMQVEVAR